MMPVSTHLLQSLRSFNTENAITFWPTYTRPSPLPPFMCVCVCVYRSSQWGQLTQWTSSCHREQVVPTSAAALICLHPATTSLVPVVTAALASPPAVEPHRLLHTLQVRKHTHAHAKAICVCCWYINHSFITDSMILTKKIT